jgi:K+/H+ antiporter YhaU regulatory subunit KhtT
MDKKIKEKVLIAKRYGFKLVRSKNHLIFRDEDGKQVVSPKTPTNRRYNLVQFERNLKHQIMSSKKSQNTKHTRTTQ